MTHPKRTRAWLKQHIEDPWVKRAQQAGYRSRAAYKLLAINQQDHLIGSGTILVDLGASPGGWAQVAQTLVGSTGHVFAVDMLPMVPIAGVSFVLGDFRNKSVVEKLLLLMQGTKPSLVISDMAPNISGNRDLDQSRIFALAELALAFAQDHLKPGGHFVVKVFQGEAFLPYMTFLKKVFKTVVSRKPPASRSHSKEIFLIGKHKL